jgi:hypothetical protein
MNQQDRFKEVYKKVNQLTYSDMGTYELMDFANEACALACQADAFGNRNPYLEELRKIRDRQVRPLIEEELVREEREKRFGYAKVNLQLNLKGCCL